jgi:hypothetical protein
MYFPRLCIRCFPKCIIAKCVFLSDFVDECLVLALDALLLVGVCVSHPLQLHIGLPPHALLRVHVGLVRV